MFLAQLFVSYSINRISFHYEGKKFNENVTQKNERQEKKPKKRKGKNRKKKLTEKLFIEGNEINEKEHFHLLRPLNVNVAVVEL